MFARSFKRCRQARRLFAGLQTGSPEAERTSGPCGPPREIETLSEPRPSGSVPSRCFHRAVSRRCLTVSRGLGMWCPGGASLACAELSAQSDFCFCVRPNGTAWDVPNENNPNTAQIPSLDSFPGDQSARLSLFVHLHMPHSPATQPGDERNSLARAEFWLSRCLS